MYHPAARVRIPSNTSMLFKLNLNCDVKGRKKNNYKTARLETRHTEKLPPYFECTVVIPRISAVDKLNFDFRV